MLVQEVDRQGKTRHNEDKCSIQTINKLTIQSVKFFVWKYLKSTKGNLGPVYMEGGVALASGLTKAG